MPTPVARKTGSAGFQHLASTTRKRPRHPSAALWVGTGLGAIGCFLNTRKPTDSGELTRIPTNPARLMEAGIREEPEGSY